MSVSQNYPEIAPSLNLSFALTKKLDPRITFARASTGAYYDGKTVAKSEENLFLRSQEFDNSFWAAFNARTVTANATTAPDGTTTADEVLANSADTNNGAFESTVAVAVGATISFYAKASTVDFVAVGAAGTAFNAWFDLSAGTVGSSANCTASIVDVGSGWYRCILANVTVGASRCLIAPKPTTGTGDPWSNVTNSIGDSVYLWGAQLEQRSSVTAYTPTTTQPITNYIPVLQTAPANVARFDHNPVTGESLGLLVEEQRTNLFTYSEDFADASWTKSNATVQSNVIVAPDGTLTGDKLVESAVSGFHSLSKTSGTAGVTKVFSTYAKAAERQSIVLGIVGTLAISYDLTSGTVTIVTGGASVLSSGVDYVGNGWYRCWFSATGTGFQIFPAIGSTYNYAGDGYSGIYIWGAQLEAGAFPTSYIKTEASQVTRSADSASMTGENFSSWYRADVGSVYADYSGYTGVVGALVNIRNSAAIFNNVHDLFVRSTSYSYGVKNNNVFQVSMGTATLEGKAAFAYKLNDFAVSNNGNIATDTLGLLPVGQDQLFIGTNGSNLYSGTIKKIAFYPARLDNTQLQALTS